MLSLTEWGSLHPGPGPIGPILGYFGTPGRVRSASFTLQSVGVCPSQRTLPLTYLEIGRSDDGIPAAGVCLVSSCSFLSRVLSHFIRQISFSPTPQQGWINHAAPTLRAGHRGPSLGRVSELAGVCANPRPLSPGGSGSPAKDYGIAAYLGAVGFLGPLAVALDPEGSDRIKEGPAGTNRAMHVLPLPSLAVQLSPLD